MQLTAGVAVLLGEVVPHGFKSAPYNYEFYMSIWNSVFGLLGITYGVLNTFVPSALAITTNYTNWINSSGLITGGVGLTLYFLADATAGAFTQTESVLSLFAECFAIAFGLIHLFGAYKVNKVNPQALLPPTNCTYPSSDPACNTSSS